MESLYVCLFSNGHIKVGRSINPPARIAAHAERVGCMGVELVEHAIFPCADSIIAREDALIARCREAAEQQFKDEWFDGLTYREVLCWAEGFAVGEVKPKAKGRSRWSELLTELRSAGMTQMQIAERCGCDQSTISALYSGRAREPLHSLGEKLLALRA
jgi:hypothetical protein